MSTLNFNDLPVNTPFEGILGAKGSGNDKRKFVWLTILYLASMIVLTLVAPLEAREILILLSVALLLLACVIGLIIGLVSSIRDKKYKSYENSFATFLAANNFITTTETSTPETAAPLVYDMGDSNSVTQGFTGLVSSVPFTTYVYTYIRRSKNRDYTYPFTILRFSLSKSLPHLVLDSRKNDGLVSSIPRYFNDDQRIVLEGDFNKYFDLFSPRDYEIEALDILSPDFMQMLIDFHTDFDVEINKTEVYLISKGIKYDRKSMQEMFTAAEVLIEKFDQKLKVWSMAGMTKNLPELDSHIDESAIRIGGKRITTAVFTIPLIALYVAGRLSEIYPNIWVFLALFCAVVILMVLWRKKRIKRS